MRDRQAVQQAERPPRAAASSAAAARASADSKVRVTIALMAGSNASIRAMCAVTTSRADTSRLRSSPARSMASCMHRSLTATP